MKSKSDTNELAGKKISELQLTPYNLQKKKLKVIHLTDSPTVKRPIIPYCKSPNPVVTLPAAEDAHPPAYGPSITRLIANSATQLVT